jgi:nucleotide-binding universal stress UspA family protein
MKTYRRILVPVSGGGQSDQQLQRAAELAQAQQAQMLVVRVLDTRSGFEPDGPAAVLPSEAAARRAPGAKKRLDLQLTRNNLAWAESKVVWGEPEHVLTEVIRDWKPDLVVSCAGQLPHALVEGTDMLTVARRSRLRNLAGIFLHPAPRHA